MTFIEPSMGWFEISEFPIIDQSSVRISKIFNEVWLSIYPRPQKLISDNGSEFNRNFIPSLKYFSAQPTCTAIKYPQANAILEIIHQVIGIMLNTKDLDNITFDAVAPWSKILVSIAYTVGCSYHITLQATPGTLFFCRDMLLDINLQRKYKEMWLRKQKTYQS